MRQFHCGLFGQSWPHPIGAQILQGPAAALVVHQRGSGSPELAAGDNVQQLHLPDGPQDLDGLLVGLGQRGCGADRGRAGGGYFCNPTVG